jgi:hypothetical protein
MEVYLIIVGVISIAFTIFMIYFIFKILEFVIVAANLYREIIEGQDSIVNILIDIRDNTKKYDSKNKHVGASEGALKGGSIIQKKHSDVEIENVVEKNSFKDGDIIEYHIKYKSTSFIVYNVVYLNKYYMKDSDGKKIFYPDMDACVKAVKDYNKQ